MCSRIDIKELFDNNCKLCFIFNQIRARVWTKKEFLFVLKTLGGNEMKKGQCQKAFIYFLSVSFLLMMSGFPGAIAQAKEIGLPIGEMVSRGEVKFEVREKVWKNVDLSHFPIFQGVKMKTENGTSLLALANHCQIEVGPNSLLTFDQNDRLYLLQGSINFRIPATAGMEFKVGNLLMSPSRSLQASKSPSAVLPKIEEAIGSIVIHSNGAVTVKSIKGSLSILSQERVVLAALSPRDSVTIPSVTVQSPSRVMVAQVGETAREVESKEKKRLAAWYWVGGGLVAAGVAAGIAIPLSRHHGHHERIPIICP